MNPNNNLEPTVDSIDNNWGYLVVNLWLYFNRDPQVLTSVLPSNGALVKANFYFSLTESTQEAQQEFVESFFSSSLRRACKNKLSEIEIHFCFTY